MTTVLFALFFGLMLLGVPIAFATAIAGAVFIMSSPMPNLVVAQRMFVASDSFSLMAIPLFVLAGEFMNSSGVTKRIVRFSNAVVGHFTGGLAHITILASMLFAGMSGSSGAAAASVGVMMIPSMKLKGYSPEFAAVVTASGSVIGPIIPPSIAAFAVKKGEYEYRDADGVAVIGAWRIADAFTVLGDLYFRHR